MEELLVEREDGRESVLWFERTSAFCLRALHEQRTRATSLRLHIEQSTESWDWITLIVSTLSLLYLSHQAWLTWLAA